MGTHCESRRHFLKTSALGAVGMMAAGGAVKKASGAWTPRMAINPNISNLRVVCCHDPDMVKYDPTSWSFENQNAAVDMDRVYENLDRMAMTLAQKPTASEAWATIFRKPAAKQWSEVRGAIKVNTLNTAIMSRAAVAGKVCVALHELGVPYGNMVVYDWNDKHWNSIATVQYNNYLGNEIPDGVLINNDNNAPNEQGTPVDYLHGHMDAQIEGYGPVKSITDLVTGAIDILVNIAVNKGHGLSGKMTLAMKNHYGSFFPWDHGEIAGGLGWHQSIAAINKNDAIIGGNPPRQQLCIIDSLWGHSYGVAEPPDCTPARLIMGTFAPALDAVTVMRLRIPVMGSVVQSVAASLDYCASPFGYDFAADYQSLQFVMVDSPTASRTSAGHRTGELKVVLSSKDFRPAQIALPIELSGRAWTVSIFDMKGNLIREIRTTANLKDSITVRWDGTAQSGIRIPQGTYVVKIRSGSVARSASFSLVRSR
jgi:hypothetical protein